MLKTYAGLLSTKQIEGEHDALILIEKYSTRFDNEPLAEILKELKSKMVTVRYWISDSEISKEEAMTTFVANSMGGMLESKFNVRYSELTGYLWTDEELTIGGHDLLAELKTFVGKYPILEVEIHQG